VYPNPQSEAKASVTVEKVNQVLGITLTGAEVADAFQRLDFAYKEENGLFEVVAPFERLDIAIAEDLIEEVGRIIGYDRVPGKELPPFTKSPEVNKNFYWAEKIREYLTSQGRRLRGGIPGRLRGMHHGGAQEEAAACGARRNRVGRDRSPHRRGNGQGGRDARRSTALRRPHYRDGAGGGAGMSEHKTTDDDPPRSDYGAWLSEFQKLATNVRWWINHGQVETATREINALWDRWRETKA
jgi:hypothetical protein